MKIIKLDILNVEGLRTLEVIPSNGVNLISGANGSGKTSLLDGIRIALTNRGTRSHLVNSEVEEGRIFFELDNGLLGDRTVKKGGYTGGPVSLKGGEGRISRAQTFLDNLGVGLAFNPLDFIGLSDEEQTKMLLEIVPVEISQEELIALGGGEPFEGVNYTLHPLQVIEKLEQALFDERRFVRRNAREYNATAENLLEEVPPTFDEDAVRDFSLEDAATQLNRIETHQRNIAVYEKEEVRLKQQIASLQAQLAGVIEQRVTETALLQDLPESGDLRQQIADYKRDQSFLSKINESRNSRVQAIEYEKRAGKLGELLEAVRAKPAELLANATLPIEGLAIQDGKVTINGLPISELSTGEKLHIAVEIAVATMGELKVLLIDGFERLDPVAQETVLSRVKAASIQAFIATVGEGALTIITEYDKMEENNDNDEIPF